MGNQRPRQTGRLSVSITRIADFAVDCQVATLLLLVVQPHLLCMCDLSVTSTPGQLVQLHAANF